MEKFRSRRFAMLLILLLTFSMAVQGFGVVGFAEDEEVTGGAPIEALKNDNDNGTITTTEAPKKQTQIHLFDKTGLVTDFSAQSVTVYFANGSSISMEAQGGHFTAKDGGQYVTDDISYFMVGTLKLIAGTHVQLGTEGNGGTINCDITSVPSPIATTQAPVTTTEAPVTTTQAPVTTTEAPVTTTQAPVTTTEAPVTTTQAPVTTTEAPVTTTQAPVTTTEAPVTTTQAPVTTEAPVTTTQAPPSNPPTTNGPSNPDRDRPDPPVIRLQDEPIALAAPVIIPAPPKEEPLEVLAEAVPMGVPVLPKTGELPVELFYGLGGVLTALGAFMKRK